MTGNVVRSKGKTALGLVHRERQRCGKSAKPFPHLYFITLKLDKQARRFFRHLYGRPWKIFYGEC